MRVEAPPVSQLREPIDLSWLKPRNQYFNDLCCIHTIDFPPAELSAICRLSTKTVINFYSLYGEVYLILLDSRVY